MSLYVQLDDACRRVADDGCIGGPLVLLSVWMWERFSVGRPKVSQWQPWDDHGNPLRRPTWAYKWDVVSEFTGDPKPEYVRYTNEFDALTPEQVLIVMKSFNTVKIRNLTSSLYPLCCRSTGSHMGGEMNLDTHQCSL